MSDKYFKISSALKNLIGGDLITDNFVAVFELVKNSFDARATEVIITFENLYSTDAKIIIQDNGKGMDYTDLTEKWLFLGYSGKRDGTEDYRDKINSGRIYAGAKGVGRFSCDRLGKYLNLISKSELPNSKIENVFVDWSKFELNQKVEFSQIPVEHKILDSWDYNIVSGTVLEISGIAPDFWNRDNLKKLKEKLSKLIRPDLNSSKDVQKFNIFLSVPDELEKDQTVFNETEKDNNNIQLYYNTINGKIENFVFNELDIKTTRIESFIDDNGIITSRLTDRENFIYEIKEKSEYNLLSNIGITLYFLNRSAKLTFRKRTGVEHIDYGSVFVYKNGFRIYPYGERRDDSLGLENRALQGYARYIGLRNLLGEVSITGNNHELKETTSRGDGLVKTKTYNQLANTEDGYLVKLIRRLEKYVVDVTQWGVNAEDETENLSNDNVKENLVKLIANISDDKSIISLDYNNDIINLIANKEEKSAKKLVRNFKRIAEESQNKQLYKEALLLEKAITVSQQRVESAEKERDIKILENKNIEQILEQKQEQLKIVTSISSQDIELVTNLHHQINVVSDNINSLITDFGRRMNSGKKITDDDLRLFIQELSYENSKIFSFSRFGIKKIFEDFTSKARKDIISFLDNYVNKIAKQFSTSRIKLNFTNPNKDFFETKFSPLDISIIVDNMISNSKKAGATVLNISSQISSDGSLNLLFKDNGNGLHSSINEINNIFEMGYSTTKSTGLGLYHIKTIVVDNKWEITAKAEKNKKGCEFLIRIQK